MLSPVAPSRYLLRSFWILFAVAAVTWWPVLDCGWIWDDDDYVTQNPLLRTFGGLFRIWGEPSALPQYYPLVHTTFWLEYRLYGLHALGYHATNAVLHAAAAWQLFLWCRQLALPVALAPALWFLVHPVHVESVAWVTERKNVLSLLCALYAARQWLQAYDGGSARAGWRGTAAFVGALLSKTVVASLPAVLLVVLWWRDGALPRRAVRSLLPWFLLALAFGAWTAVLEATHVGAADPRFQLQGWQRLLLAGRAPWFYLGSLLWPFEVCFQYPRWRLEVGELGAWAWPAATALVLGLAFVLRGRLGRAPLATLLVFGGVLVPALGVVDVFPFRYSYVADHFQYHASVVVLVAFAALGHRWLAALPRAVPIALGALLLVGNVAWVWRTVPDYRDADTLWQRTLARNPDSTLALLNLGGLAVLRGDDVQGKVLIDRALALDPTSHEGWNNLGILASRRGDAAEARRLCERAHALKPDDASINRNLAALWLDAGQPHVAKPFAEQAVASDPQFLEAQQTLGRALHDCGEWERALVPLDHVLQRLPQDAAARRYAVQCLLRLGRGQQAASNALVLVQQDPRDEAGVAVLVQALAAALRTVPPGDVRNVATAACSKHGVDFARLQARVEAALRALGATGQADALR